MNEIELKQYVESTNDEVFTTSRKVAEKFGKKHTHVVRNIKKLTPSVDVSNFGPIPYLDDYGRDQIEYKITKVGYILLAMRFTGPEALKVQVQFVKAFEKMESLIKDLTKGESEVIKFQKANMFFPEYIKTAQHFGLVGNQALLCASKAIKREYGFDLQSMLQIELKSEVQTIYLSPTEIGKQSGDSPQKINKKLESMGYQKKLGKIWVPTEAGKKHCTILDAGKKHSNGTPIQQIKWDKSLLN